MSASVTALLQSAKAIGANPVVILETDQQYGLFVIVAFWSIARVY